MTISVPNMSGLNNKKALLVILSLRQHRGLANKKCVSKETLGIPCAHEFENA
jgi:hypothetical protein